MITFHLKKYILTFIILSFCITTNATEKRQQNETKNLNWLSAHLIYFKTLQKYVYLTMDMFYSCTTVFLKWLWKNVSYILSTLYNALALYIYNMHRCSYKLSICGDKLNMKHYYKFIWYYVIQIIKHYKLFLFFLISGNLISEHTQVTIKKLEKGWHCLR